MTSTEQQIAETVAAHTKAVRVAELVMTPHELPEDRTFKICLPLYPNSSPALAHDKDKEHMVFLRKGMRLMRFCGSGVRAYCRARLFKNKLYVVRRVEDEGW